MDRGESHSSPSLTHFSNITEEPTKHGIRCGKWVLRPTSVRRSRGGGEGDVKQGGKKKFITKDQEPEQKIQLSLGYTVRSIKRVGEGKTSDGEAQTTNNFGAAQDPDRLVLELWPLQVQTLDADLVLWTVGSKPLLPQIERNWLPLIEQGQAKTDELCQGPSTHICNW